MPNRVYLVNRDCDGLDEWDSFIVVAPSPKAARKIVVDAKKNGDPNYGHGGDTAEDWEKASVSIVRLEKSAIVHGSFNAG